MTRGVYDEMTIAAFAVPGLRPSRDTRFTLARGAE
jgi:hypothetical protein